MTVDAFTIGVVNPSGNVVVNKFDTVVDPFRSGVVRPPGNIVVVMLFGRVVFISFGGVVVVLFVSFMTQCAFGTHAE